MILKRAKEWAKKNFLPIPEDDDTQGIQELLNAYEDSQS